MNSPHSRRAFIIITACFLIVISVPYVLAAKAAGQEMIFGGFLLNPLDGNTYLAKMVTGWRGEWLFTLPYTAEKGEGHLLFIFYIFLGHLARLFSLPLITTFHLARLLAAFILLVSLFRFLSTVLKERKVALFAFALAAFGSGIGWLALAAGTFTSDFWVAETYPFLSAYANPHFPLGLSLVLWLLTPEKADWIAGQDPFRSTANCSVKGHRNLANMIGITLVSFALAAISPFGLVLVLAVLSTLLVVELGQFWFENRKSRKESSQRRRLGVVAEIFPARRGSLQPFDSTVQRLPWVFLSGAPLLMYELWVIRSDPLLSSWNVQNLTPSPPVWDLIIALSPVLFLAIPGTWAAIKDNTPGSRILLIWAGTSLALLYFPFNLQRRFMMGLYVPLAGLAALGVHKLASGINRCDFRQKRFYTLAVLLLLIAIPTNLVILLAARQGVQTRDPHLYLSQGEAQVFQWLAKNTAPDAVVLAAPDTGLLIPAYTGRRVIYGHPFETANAGNEKEWVEGYFQNGNLDLTTLRARGINYIIAGPRERELNSSLSFSDLIPIYRSGGVNLYAVPPAQ